MRNMKRSFFLVAALAMLAVSLSCTGFFVNQPNSIAVTTGPNGAGTSTFSVPQNQSVKLFATASFNSGSKDVTGSANWQSSSPCATVIAGIVTGVAPASGVTITASVGGITGSATGTVTGSGGQALVIAPQGPFTLATTPSVQFTASQNGTDVTNSVTWSSSNTSVLQFSSSAGFANLLTAGSSTVTASLATGNSCASGSELVNVN